MNGNFSGRTIHPPPPPPRPKQVEEAEAPAIKDLRDYFAGAAMAAFMAPTLLDRLMASAKKEGVHWPLSLAENSYVVADVMLLERAREVAKPEASSTDDGVAQIKEIVRRVIDDPETRIYGPDAVLLMNWAHNFKPVAVTA